jgi:hypothetical protein
MNHKQGCPFSNPVVSPAQISKPIKDVKRTDSSTVATPITPA